MYKETAQGLKDVLMIRAKSMGPCSVEGFLYEARYQWHSNMTEEQILIVVNELVNEGQLELVNPHDMAQKYYEVPAGEIKCMKHTR